MTATNLDLERILAYLLTARREALSAQVNSRVADRAIIAEKAAAASVDALNAAIGRLQTEGIEATGEKDVVPSDSLSLSALASLASLDTPTARELRDQLQGVMATAERLDKERGNWYENAPATDTRGTDIAEKIYHLIRRLDLELSGPRSRRGE